MQILRIFFPISLQNMQCYYENNPDSQVLQKTLH